jgi:hypothetical protein
MENDQEVCKVNSQFSTLNVNAVEFVPSFVVSTPKELALEESPPPPVTKSAFDEPPEKNGNGKR